MSYRKTLAAIALFTAVFANAQTHSFVIVTDPQTFDHCQSAIETYRKAVCTDGLDAFVVSKDWADPNELKDSLMLYHKTKALDGAVFVGDIPIAMVRGAQHLTSAFKMDETMPMRDSSVPSDRFYDDFDLEWEFCGRDSVETNFFYYTLTAESPQHISCDIYTGRIKSSEKRGDKYGEISRYLLKAAAAKSQRNPLDHVMSYSGSGSFSNSLAAWKDETITLREQMPAAFENGADGTKFLFYAMFPDVKGTLLREIAREELDLALFHEHGVPERQYVTETPRPNDPDSYFYDAKYRMREKIRTAVSRGKDAESIIKEITEKYGISRDWVEDWNDPETEAKDSLYDAATGIMLDDIAAAKPNVKMSIFDACYNGDFREDDCIASRYIFSEGGALVGIGNSVNVLQDKSSSDLLGMLSEGYNVGQWMQQVNILESHILGDPTFHFTARKGAVCPDLHNEDCDYWLKYTAPKYPCDIRGLALHKLYALDYKDLSSLLLNTWKESDEYMLRLQCLHLLEHYADGNYEKVLKDGADDPYEFIRRKSAYFMGKVGTPEMATELAELYLRDYNSLRVAQNVGFVCAHFPDSLFLKEFEKKFAKADWIYDRELFHAKAMGCFRQAFSIESSTGKSLSDQTNRYRKFYISGMRNQPYPQHAEALLSIVRDSNETETARVQCAEVLGWFIRAWNRKHIVDEIDAYLTSGEEMPGALKNELVKTRNRLHDYLRCSIRTEQSSIKSPTTFAIITDNETLARCYEELYAYKQVLEEEGLGTYIISSDWNSPDEVKAEILALAGQKSKLEGVVFVGDIPIVKVRQGQHLTTAFKMNEEVWPMQESSVPSDRFYDDFKLDFDFICRDTVETDVFYYRLSEKGAQHLHPDIYSARMKVPAVMKGDKYEIMRKYLRKVVNAHRQGNTLDDLTFFAGHGYNSDCLTIWRQKPIVFREYFPYAFAQASHNRFLNFREDRNMKWNLLGEVAREDVDLFIFSEHGAPDIQYINESKVANNLDEDMDYLRRSLAESYKYYQGRGLGEDFMKEAIEQEYKLSRNDFCDSAMTAYAVADSLEFEAANINLSDIMKGHSNAKMIVFNACYNGSFHNRQGYVAGCHVFGDGECIVAQGNTVNVLQDKWEDKLMGYLSIGERVGMWQKEVSYLESHLIGDPTFRFTPHDDAERKLRDKLHNDLIFNSSKPSVWKKYTHSDNSLLRCAGITHLGYIDAKAAHKRAAEMLGDSSWTVRVHAFNTLATNPDADFSNYIRKGLNDIYELVDRNAVKMAAASGDTTLVCDVKAFKERHPEMVRASGYAADDAIALLTGTGHYKKSIEGAIDKDRPAKRRVNDIRTFRNGRSIYAIEPLLSIVRDASDDIYVRTVACETLGWYEQSIRRGEIVEALIDMLEHETDVPEQVKAEIKKTIKRLLWQ